MQQRQHLALHERAIADGVLGLDEDLHRPLPVQHQLDKGVQRQQAGIPVRAVSAPTAMPRPVFQLPKFGQRHGADQTGAARRPVEPAVVHADQVPVAGEPDVAFHAVGALPEGEIVCGQGVFRSRSRRAAMGHHVRVPRDPLVGPHHAPMLPVLHPSTPLLQQIPTRRPRRRRPPPSGGRDVRPAFARIPRRAARSPAPRPMPTGKRR